MKKDPTVAPNISGITTPDDHTIVFQLTQPQSAVVIQILSLPVSAPVPEEYAKKMDAQTPSSYGQNVVFTGPYMVQNDCVNSSGKVVNPNCTGKLTGYTPGKEIQPGSEPELGSEHGLPACVCRRDHDPGGIHGSDSGVAEDPLGL